MKSLLRLLIAAMLVAGASTACAKDGPPAGWDVKRSHSQGVEIVELIGPGPEEQAPQLLEARFPFPVFLADLDGLLDGFVANLTDVEVVKELPAPFEEFTAHHSAVLMTEKGVRLRSELIALVDGADVKIVGFNAPEEEFHRLGGADFLARRLLGASSLAEAAQSIRQRRITVEGDAPDAVLAENAAGDVFTHADFAMCVRIAQLAAGSRLPQNQVEGLRDEIVASFDTNDDWATTRRDLKAFLAQLDDAPSAKVVTAAERLYADAWRASRATREPDVIFDAVLRANPLVVSAGDVPLSTRAVEARLATVRLYLEWTGVSGAAASARLEKAEAEIRKNFASMPALSRDRLTKAQSRYLKLWASSSQWSDDDKRKALEKAAIWTGSSKSDVARAEQLEQEAHRRSETAALHNIIRAQGVLDGYKVGGILN